MIKFTRQNMRLEQSMAKQHRAKDVSDQLQSNFLQSFKPIYYFSRVFGLMPFSIVCNSSGEIQKHRVNRFDAAWFIVSICVFSLVAFLTYEHLIYVHNDAFILNSIVFFDNIHITMELVFAVLFIGMDMYNRSYIVDMMKLLATFDKEVN